MADEAKKDPNEATRTADLYHRHGEDRAEDRDEAPAYNARPSDVAPDNSTFADRAKHGPLGKKVVASDTAENKAVSSAAKKAPARKSSK